MSGIEHRNGGLDEQQQNKGEINNTNGKSR